MQTYSIVSCDYSLPLDQYIFTVDVEMSFNRRRYLVRLNRKDVPDVKKVREHIEADIAAQNQPLHDWTGVSWSS